MPYPSTIVPSRFMRYAPGGHVISNSSSLPQLPHGTMLRLITPRRTAMLRCHLNPQAQHVISTTTVFLTPPPPRQSAGITDRRARPDQALARAGTATEGNGTTPGCPDGGCVC